MRANATSFARQCGHIRPVSKVERIEAHHDSVLVHRAQREHLLSLRIGDQKQRLPHPPFIRVPRAS
jgi:DNA-binding LytR/AlgR family response regulator